MQCDTKATINIGIGRHHPGIQGLAKSYQDARAALSLGGRFHGQNQVHCLDELGIAAFVGISDESTKIDLAKHLLSPLEQEQVKSKNKVLLTFYLVLFTSSFILYLLLI